MVFASSTASILSRLLLVTMLFHQGHQAPTPPSETTCSSPSGKTLTCKSIADEIIGELDKNPVPELELYDQMRRLEDENLQRENLCEFLKMREALDPMDNNITIKANLEKLKCCLSPPVGSPKYAAVVIQNDLVDFKRNLRFFVDHLTNLLPVPRSDSVTSGPVIKGCQKGSD
ncbi:interleukin-3-like [Acomys russatus]|uniref:interleukin-3-like n=1 Tax=Acomys russatus TaxID=60746 RepID=UPI0021E2F5F0|nr:interleukin-3-like [Acomys russatus]